MKSNKMINNKSLHVSFILFNFEFEKKIEKIKDLKKIEIVKNAMLRFLYLLINNYIIYCDI